MRAPDAAPLTAGDVLTLAELRDLRRTSSLRGAALIGHAWLVIAGAVALYVAWPSWITLAVVIPVIGGRQLGLAVLMHEAAHHLLVFVPCRRLRDAHRLLLARGYGARMELAPSYAALVRRATAS